MPFSAPEEQPRRHDDIVARVCSTRLALDEEQMQLNVIHRWHHIGACDEVIQVPLHQETASALRTQQRLDRTALIHSAVALRHLLQGQFQVEDFARVYLALPDPVNEVRQEAAHRCWAAVQMDF
ncbi:hypothetical protein KSC_093800 [Ktedonobacter sp. SOSP1-52]|nr:hypothetical protein KSC_093800 [Ktedonobacter sp. SOSP1-52]